MQIVVFAQDLKGKFGVIPMRSRHCNGGSHNKRTPLIVSDWEGLLQTLIPEARRPA
jgi:hypothetical protein